jgi:hypothetical protein
MKILLYGICISIILISCNGEKSKYSKIKLSKANKDSLSHPVTGRNHFLKFGQKTLLSNITPHLFSSNSKKDTFKLILTGDSICTATAIFSIISYTGKRIYADTFYSTELFFIEDSVLAPSQQEAGIRERVKTFFEDSAFSTPAINPGEEANTEDPLLWEEIKSDKTAIGFNYHYGEEDDQCIAYSKKQHRVLIYWGCC